jgi:Spy/CpxP family protein refolding chaperone
MRKMILTLALGIGLVLPALAQFGPGFGGGFGQTSGDALLNNKSVQKELKLTEEQIKAIEELTSAQREAMKEAFPLFREDREKATEIMKKAQTEMTSGLKKVREGLTSEQSKRFSQIKIQVAAKNKDLKIFQDEEVVKVLGLTTKQQDTVKETLAGIEKDVQELRDEAKGDFRKMRDIFKKSTELTSEGWDTVVKSLSDDQKKSWEDAQGEKFELKMDKGGFGGGKQKNKGGKKKDDI